jgi:hypothetical protein
MQIHDKLVEHPGNKALSYLDVSHWVRQFLMRRESIEDSRRSGRPPDFQTHFRIEGALEASPNASIRDIVRLPALLRQRYSMTWPKFFI